MNQQYGEMWGYCIKFWGVSKDRDLPRNYRLMGKGMGLTISKSGGFGMVRGWWCLTQKGESPVMWANRQRFIRVAFFPFLGSQWIASSCSKHVQEASVASRCSDRLRLRAKHIAALEGCGHLESSWMWNSNHLRWVSNSFPLSVCQLSFRVVWQSWRSLCVSKMDVTWCNLMKRSWCRFP